MRTRVTQLGLGSLMMVVLGMLASPVPRASAGACATIRHFETSFAAAAGTTSALAEPATARVVKAAA